MFAWRRSYGTLRDQVSAMWSRDVGKRREFALSVLGDGHGGDNPEIGAVYPDMQFRHGEALYASSRTLVYTVVPIEPTDGDSEISWIGLGQIRLWGAIAFSLRAGRGFFWFQPLTGLLVYAEGINGIDEAVLHRAATRLAQTKPPQNYALRPVGPDHPNDVAKLYEALQAAEVPLLRGVSCYLKAHMLWRHYAFTEEMAINLYIALEGGLSVIRRRLSQACGRTVSYRDVFDFVRATFPYGDGLAEYWEDAHDDRNALLHPDNDFSPHVIQPMSADDVYELFDPMLSLYRYLLIGDATEYEEITAVD